MAIQRFVGMERLVDLVRRCRSGEVGRSQLRILDVLALLPTPLTEALVDDDWQVVTQTAVACAGDDGDGSREVAPAQVRNALIAISSLRASLELLELRILRTARAGGFSWGEIARALGMSRQAAWERWADVIDRDKDYFCLAVFADGTTHVVRTAREGVRRAACGKAGSVRVRPWTTYTDLDCAACYRLVGP